MPAETVSHDIDRIEAIVRALPVSSEKAAVLDAIVLGAMELFEVDGSSIYLLEGDELEFEVVRSQRLDFHLGGTSRHEIPFAPIRLHDDHGQPNNHMIVAYAANHKQTVNIEDVYQNQRFDFDGTKEFDKLLNYYSQSILALPLLENDGSLIGVLQLLNRRDSQGHTTVFSDADTRRAEHYARQAGRYLSERLGI